MTEIEEEEFPELVGDIETLIKRRNEHLSKKKALDEIIERLTKEKKIRENQGYYCQRCEDFIDDPPRPNRWVDGMIHCSWCVKKIEFERDLIGGIVVSASVEYSHRMESITIQKDDQQYTIELDTNDDDEYYLAAHNTTWEMHQEQKRKEAKR